MTYRFHPSKYGISTAISQDLIVFPDSSEAKKEFTNQISYYKSVNLTLHEEDLSNQGNKSMESFARGCREVVKQGFYNQPAAETRYCVSVSLYKNVLSVVNAHVFTDQLLTMEKYNDLVDTLNRRIVTAFRQPN